MRAAAVVAAASSLLHALVATSGAEPMTMQACTDLKDQEITTYGPPGTLRHPSVDLGMIQLLHRPGTCLEANRTTMKLTAEPCNNLTAGQRFFFTGDHGAGAYVNGAHQDKVCITANCTAHGPRNVTCMEGAPIGVAPCVTQWPGSPIPNTPDPLQIWDKQAEHGEPHTMVLAYTWDINNHPKHGEQVNSTSCLTIN